MVHAISNSAAVRRLVHSSRSSATAAQKCANLDYGAAAEQEHRRCMRSNIIVNAAEEIPSNPKANIETLRLMQVPAAHYCGCMDARTLVVAQAKVSPADREGTPCSWHELEDVVEVVLHAHRTSLDRAADPMRV